jgi:hypothetical protein
MRAYKVIPPRAYAPVAYLSGMDSAKPLDAALEEFQATYGFKKDNTIHDLRKRNQAQVNLARDASYLGLEHNPLYHDLSLVFVDWAKKRFGYTTLDPNEATNDAVDFKFPY